MRLETKEDEAQGLLDGGRGYQAQSRAEGWRFCEASKEPRSDGRGTPLRSPVWTYRLGDSWYKGSSGRPGNSPRSQTVQRRSGGGAGALRGSQRPTSAQASIPRPDWSPQAGEGAPSLGTWADVPSQKKRALSLKRRASNRGSRTQLHLSHL